MLIRSGIPYNNNYGLINFDHVVSWGVIKKPNYVHYQQLQGDFMITGTLVDGETNEFMFCGDEKECYKYMGFFLSAYAADERIFSFKEAVLI